MKDINYYDVMCGALFDMFYTPEMIDALDDEEDYPKMLTGINRKIWDFTSALRNQLRANAEAKSQKNMGHIKFDTDIDKIIDRFKDLQIDLGVNVTL